MSGEQRFVQPGWIGRAAFVVLGSIMSGLFALSVSAGSAAAMFVFGIGAVAGVTGALCAEITVIDGAPPRLRCWQQLLLFRWGHREVSPEDIISIECGPIDHAGPTEMIELLWWPLWMLVRKRYQVHC